MCIPQPVPASIPKAIAYKIMLRIDDTHVQSLIEGSIWDIGTKYAAQIPSETGKQSLDLSPLYDKGFHAYAHIIDAEDEAERYSQYGIGTSLDRESMEYLRTHIVIVKVVLENIKFVTKTEPMEYVAEQCYFSSIISSWHHNPNFFATSLSPSDIARTIMIP